MGLSQTKNVNVHDLKPKKILIRKTHCIAVPLIDFIFAACNCGACLLTAVSFSILKINRQAQNYLKLSIKIEYTFFYKKKISWEKHFKTSLFAKIEMIEPNLNHLCI